MANILKQSTSVTVRVGPALDATDAVSPETGLSLSTADQAEALKAGGVATVDISGNTFAAVTGADGWYDLTLGATDVDTVGELVIVIQDSSLMLPIFARFQVVEEAIYDALFASSAAGFDSNGRVDLGSILGSAAQATSGELHVLDGDGNALAVASVQPANQPTVDVSGHTEAIAPDGTNFNDLSQAEANAAADTALTDYDPPTKAEMDAAFTEIKGATWASSTDTLEAIRDRGDAAWVTATGFSTHNAADVRTEMDNNSTQLAAILTDTGTTIPGILGTPAGVSLAADIAENQTDLDAILTDLTDGTLVVGTIQNNVITAASIAASALDGKGDWSVPMTSGTAQSGTGTSITLASDESSQNQIFRDQAIRIVAGTGQGQARIITGYNGTTKVADVDQAWTTNPDATSQYEIDNGLAILAQTTHSGATVPTVTDVTNAVTLTAAERNSVADAIFTRDMSNVEGSLADHMLGTLVMAGLESAVNGSGNLEIYKTDGTTVIVTKTLTTDANADPVTGVA